MRLEPEHRGTIHAELQRALVTAGWTDALRALPYHPLDMAAAQYGAWLAALRKRPRTAPSPR